MKVSEAILYALVAGWLVLTAIHISILLWIVGKLVRGRDKEGRW